MPFIEDCFICQEKTESKTVVDQTFIGSPPILVSDLLLQCLGSEKLKEIPKHTNNVLCNVCEMSLNSFYEASQRVLVKRDEFISRINRKNKRLAPVEYYVIVESPNDGTTVSELAQLQYPTVIEDYRLEIEVGENSESVDGWKALNNSDEEFVKVNQPDEELECYWSSDSKDSTTNDTTLVRIKRMPKTILRYCWRCDKSFPSDDAFEVHLKLVHTKNKKMKFACNKCKTSFGSKRERSAHTSGQQCYDTKSKTQPFNQSQKAIYDDFADSICWKTMATEHSIQRHITLHRNVKKHRCPECGNTFSSKDYLKKHMNMHKDIQYFMCPVCDFKFRTAWNLKRHRKLHCLTDTNRQPSK